VSQDRGRGSITAYKFLAGDSAQSGRRLLFTLVSHENLNIKKAAQRGTVNHDAEPPQQRRRMDQRDKKLRSLGIDPNSATDDELKKKIVELADQLERLKRQQAPKRKTVHRGKPNRGEPNRGRID
jgi:hypothetical protein